MQRCSMATLKWTLKYMYESCLTCQRIWNSVHPALSHSIEEGTWFYFLLCCSLTFTYRSLLPLWLDNENRCTILMSSYHSALTSHQHTPCDSPPCEHTRLATCAASPSPSELCCTDDTVDCNAKLHYIKVVIEAHFFFYMICTYWLNLSSSIFFFLLNKMRL